ncbi:MAG TPA: FAD-binding oxidoreductase [Patescibacteria group bacterium]|nr:FAD-binding oxidoreductase [Patescibacteria group bacterium]
MARPGGPADDRVAEVLWSSGIADPGASPALASDVEADVAIVGGGFTGLAAALSIRERRPDLSVVVLEASICGAGASGRNAGMALPGCGVDLDGLETRLGAEGARRAIAWMARGLDRLVHLADGQGEAGAIERTGSLALARTPRQARDQQARLAVYRRLGVEADLIAPDALRRAIAAPGYFAGFQVPGGALLVDPWRLVRALRRAVLQAGVTLHETTPVAAIREGTPAALVCAGGTVRARSVVLAVNAWAPHLGYFRNRVAPMHVACIATEPLAPPDREAIGWKGRQALWEEGHVYHFLRLTPDDRVLIGGGGATYLAWDGMTFERRAAVFAGLERALVRILPGLSGVRVTHRWSGPVAFARDFLPSIGTLGRHRNVHYALGYTGHGVALSHLAGEVIAALVAGDEDEVAGLFLLNRPFPTLLRDPFKWIAIHAVRNGWLALDRLGL